MGIGFGLGMSPGMTAGAVLSGAYFGDKMSPLSDTTNLAPAMACLLYTSVRVERCDEHQRAAHVLVHPLPICADAGRAVFVKRSDGLDVYKRQTFEPSPSITIP